MRGDVLREAGRSKDSIEAFQTALDNAADDEQRCQAWMGIVAAHRITADIPAAMGALDHAQEIAERLGSTVQRSRIHHVRGNLLFASGRADECRNEHERALDYAQQAGDVQCEAQALSGLGDAQYARARMLSGLEYFRRCVALCESAGLVKLDIANRCMMGHCSYYANQLTESVAHIRRAGDEARRTGHAYGEIFAQESLGMLLASSGHDAQAQEEIERVMPLARRADARRYLIALLCSLAMAKLASGEDDAARAHLEEAKSFNDQTGNSFFGAVLWAGIARAARSYERGTGGAKARRGVAARTVSFALPSAFLSRCNRGQPGCAGVGRGAALRRCTRELYERGAAAVGNCW